MKDELKYKSYIHLYTLSPEGGFHRVWGIMSLSVYKTLECME